MAFKNVIAPEGKSTTHKLAGGIHTTITAADVINTGFKKLTSVVVTLETDPADANLLASAVVSASGGSFTIKTWKTDGTDPTPTAATVFGKRVNWIAFGR